MIHKRSFLNFSGDLCRGVVMVGLPYPDIKSVEINQKMNWMNKRKPGGGQILYQGTDRLLR